jgi:hypothetical protein
MIMRLSVDWCSIWNTIRKNTLTFQERSKKPKFARTSDLAECTKVQKFNNITANSASLKKKVPPSFSYHGIAIDLVLNLGYPLQRAGLGIGRLAI